MSFVDFNLLAVTPDMDEDASSQMLERAISLLDRKFQDS